MLEDVLNNRQHILICIQYEVLQKKSIDEAYKSFCKTLGGNVMEYHEFDFWYYHFLNGNYDLDYERSKDEKQRGLSDMPMDVVGKIVEKLKPIEKCIFRNVSQKCREVVDKNPLIIEYLSLNDCYRETFLRFNRQSYKYGVNKLKEIVLVESEVVIYQEDNKERVEMEVDEREECEKRVVQMLSIVLNNPRIQIGKLCFFIKEQTLMDKLHSLFNSLNHQLHVKSIHVEDRQKDPVDISLMKFLPHLKPGVLEKIELFNSTEVNWYFDSTLKKLADLEQWKQAKEFDTDQRISDNIDKVAHFDRLSVFIADNFKPENFVYLKNIYLNSPTFQYCELLADNIDEERIREELGGDRFPMADGSTLHVDIDLDDIEITFTKE